MTESEKNKVIKIMSIIDKNFAISEEAKKELDKAIYKDLIKSINNKIIDKLDNRPEKVKPIYIFEYAEPDDERGGAKVKSGFCTFQRESREFATGAEYL